MKQILYSSIIPKRSHWFYLAIALSAFLTHFNTLNVWYFSDDFHWLQFAADPGNGFTAWISHRFFDYFRPVVTLSFVFEHALYALSPSGHHAFNLLVHIICSMLIFRILRGLFPIYSSFFGALIFTAAASSCEAVIWVSGRTDLLGTLFLLAALVAARSIRQDRRKSHVGTYALLILAFLSKETAMIWPFALILCDFLEMHRCGFKGYTHALKKWVIDHWTLLILCFVMTFLHIAIHLGKTPVFASLGEVATLGSYVRNLAGASVYTLAAPFPPILSADANGFALFFILMIVSVIAAIRRHPGILCGMVLILASFTLTAQIPFRLYPTPWLTFGRFFYIAGLGLAIVWTSIFDAAFTRKSIPNRIMMLLVAVSICIASARTANRSITHWISMTNQQKESLADVRSRLAQLPEQSNIQIITQGGNFDAKMLMLFSGRDIIPRVEGQKISREQNDFVFFFRQGQLIELN